MRHAILCALLTLSVAGCTQKKPKESQNMPSPAATAPESSASKIETEVEYRYLPGHDPRDGAPYYRVYARATSDHVLSEIEVSTIRSALATHAPGRGPSIDMDDHLSKRHITGVKVGPPTFEDLHYTLEPKTDGKAKGDARRERP
jgi:hypothetical protein